MEELLTGQAEQRRTDALCGRTHAQQRPVAHAHAQSNSSSVALPGTLPIALPGTLPIALPGTLPIVAEDTMQVENSVVKSARYVNLSVHTIITPIRIQLPINIMLQMTAAIPHYSAGSAPAVFTLISSKHTYLSNLSISTF